MEKNKERVGLSISNGSNGDSSSGTWSGCNSGSTSPTLIVFAYLKSVGAWKRFALIIAVPVASFNWSLRRCDETEIADSNRAGPALVISVKVCELLSLRLLVVNGRSDYLV